MKNRIIKSDCIYFVERCYCRDEQHNIIFVCPISQSYKCQNCISYKQETEKEIKK